MPLAVCVGLNDPAVAVQVTEGLVLVSLATVAVKVVVPPVISDAVVGDIVTAIGGVPATDTAAIAAVDGFVTEVAMIFTGPPVPGAVYVVAAPLAVWVGEKVPQALAPAAHVADQVTPPFALSLVTVAVNVVVPLAARDAVAGDIVIPIALAPAPAPVKVCSWRRPVPVSFPLSSSSDRTVFASTT